MSVLVLADCLDKGNCSGGTAVVYVALFAFFAFLVWLVLR